MDRKETTCFISESNILHKCKNCKRIITTESIISNYQKIEGSLFKDAKIHKGEFVFFIKDLTGHMNEISNKVEYVLSDIKNKILCKKCDTEIGYFKLVTSKSKIIGILQPDYILSERVELKQLDPNSKSKKPKIDLVNKLLIESKINLQQVKSTNEIISSFLKDFYRIEMNSFGEKISNTDKKLKNISELLGLQAEDEDSSKQT